MPDRTDTLTTVPLAVGCWSWGDRRTWGYGTRFALADLSAATDVLLAAGVRCFDTAEIYGRGESERILGTLLAARCPQALVSSKFFPYPWRLTRSQFLRAVEGTARRLRRPDVAIYQIHHDGPWPLVRRWLDHLADARRRGLVGAIGTSNLGPGRLRQVARHLADRGERIAVHQTRYNLCDRRAERDGVLRFCREHGITVLAHSPLAQGMLTGRYGPENPPPGRRGRAVPPAALRQMAPVVALLRRYARRLGTTPAACALAWLRHRETVPLAGLHDARQARELTEAIGVRLTPEMARHLDEVTRPWLGAA